MAKHKNNVAQDEVNEDDLLKALNELEEGSGVRKGEMPKNTKKANGGLSGKGGQGPEADVDVSGNEGEPVAKGDIEDDEESDEGGEEESDEGTDDTASKSMRDRMLDNDDLRKGVEVSPFLEGLTDVVAGELESIEKSLGEFSGAQREFNGKIAKALVAIGRQQAAIAERLGVLANLPAGERRSALNKSEVQERFAQEGGGQPQFSKAQTLEIMMDMLQKGEIPAAAISTYEVSDTMDPVIAQKVTHQLKKSMGRA